MGNNYEELRSIAYKICDEISKNEKVNVDIYPVTFVEYFNKAIFNKRIKLVKKSMISALSPLLYAGIYHGETENIILFLNNFKSHYNVNNDCIKANFLKSLFHEMRHVMQYQKLPTMDGDNKYDIDKFKIGIDKCRIHDERDYMLNHDWYSHEIDADKYGINKAKEYLINSNSYNEKNKSYLELGEFYYKYRENAYNIQLSIDKVSDILREDTGMVSTFFNECGMLETYFNDDGTYKDLKEIMNDPIVHNWDSRIRYNVIVSKSFLNQLDFSKLSSEELDFVLESVNYVNNERIEKEKKNKELLSEQISRIKSVKGKYSIRYLRLCSRVVHNILRYKSNSNYYSYLQKILDEYKYHDKIDEGGKKL